MTARNPYDVLGVPRDADLDEIKRAYRRLAMECHPDRNPGDRAAEERFKDLTIAYEVLSSPEKRERYDRWGTSDGAPDLSDIFGGFGLDDAMRAFMENFGMGSFGDSRRQRRPRGADIEVPVDLGLREAALGGSRDVRIRRTEPCQECGGTGADESQGWEDCAACSGTGRTRASRRTILGTFETVETCRSCGGAGRRARKQCHACRGSGSATVDRTISVEIPPGISEGYSIRLRAQGHQPGGALPGDLSLFVRNVDCSPFARAGDDLVYDVTIGFPEAALGTTLDIPTVEGTRKLDVPSGTQPSDVLTIRGQGMGRLRGRGRGDILVRISVHVPRKLSSSERRMLGELSGSRNFRKSD